MPVRHLPALAIMTALTLGAVPACAADSTERSAGQWIDDSVTTTTVKTTLIAEPQIDALDIDVTTYRGVVQLSGVVDSRDQALRAAEAAQRIEGVQSVENNLRVKGSTK